MNAALPLLYTNEVSPEFLRTLDKSRFTEQQLAGFNEQALAIVNQQQAEAKAHPPIAIYRLVTEGSQTRNDGVIQQATAECEITLDNGQQVRIAQKGDYAVYAGSSTAQIVTGAGQGNSHRALVGSRLSNGDEIIDTPQGLGLLIVREGVPMPDDFLVSIEGGVMGRASVNGIGQGLHGDLTTTGAVCISSLPNATQGGRGVLRLGDKTTPCPQCGKIGVIVDSLPTMRWMGIATVLDGAGIHCGCPMGRNRLIAPVGQSSGTYSATQYSTVASSSMYASAQESSFGIPPRAPVHFAQSFAITDRHTGQPLTNRTYIALVDGHRKVGLTDANGIAIIEALTAESVIKLHVMFQAPTRELNELSEATV